MTTGVIPTGRRRGVVVQIWRGKGDTHKCNNYRDVTLLLVPGKVLARLFPNIFRQKRLTHQRNERPRSTHKKSTVDGILALHVLAERLRYFLTGL